MVIVITGPTAVGKTKLSVCLAKLLNGEIINADSTQVYRNMNIGTSKITEEEKEGVPHHLFDICNVTENYTVYEYQRDARLCINEIIKKGKTPILVGGSGLYIKAALYNYTFLNEQNTYDYQNFDVDTLYKELIKLDPYTNIHPHNRRRIERALTKIKNNSVFNHDKDNILLYDTLFIGLTTQRELLYERINKRVDLMVQQGLLEEAKTFYKLGIRSKAITTPICYKELFSYFDGNITLDEALNLIKQRSRRYAKRQYTWFNHQLPIIWFEVNFNDFNQTINRVYEYINELK